MFTLKGSTNMYFEFTSLTRVGRVVVGPIPFQAYDFLSSIPRGLTVLHPKYCAPCLADTLRKLLAIRQRLNKLEHSK